MDIKIMKIYFFPKIKFDIKYHAIEKLRDFLHFKNL